MQPTAVTVRVPATSANLGAGFDCLGLALDMFASITVTFSDAEQPPPDDVGAKMVTTAIRTAFDRMAQPAPAGVRVEYGLSIPLGRGLGASAVARVAGVMAANEIAGHALDEQQCLSVAAGLEGHADNACPALLGGMTVCVEDGATYRYARCRIPHETAIAVLIPDHAMATKDARRVLPDTYAAGDAVHNIGRAALFVAAMGTGDFSLLDAATDDRVHQRQRSELFAPLYDIFAAAKEAGAHAAWLSGAGSSVAAVCPPGEVRAVAQAMKASLEAAGMTGRALPTHLSREGAQISKVELVEE